MESLERVLMEQPFFTPIDSAHRAALTRYAEPAQFPPGAYLLHENAPEDRFYLLQQGRLALQVHVPGCGARRVQTLQPGEIVGLSWLIRPYRSSYDAQAFEPIRAIAFDAARLRALCGADHDFGYELMQCFMPVLLQRLQAARLQLLDVYGTLL